MSLTIPTLLTLSRIAAVPLIVLVYYLPASWLQTGSIHWANTIAAWLFVLVAVTDWLDGYLARKWRQTSAFGAFLDPVADKLLVCTCLLLLLHLHRIDIFVALIIIGRELTISALREWMAQIGASKSVAVHMVGKLKTTAQMVAIPFLLFDGRLLGLPTLPTGQALLWLAAGLTIWSMIYYLQQAFLEIRSRLPQ